MLVVDDSVFMRNMIKKLVESDPAFSVVGTARNGFEAVELTKKLKPDVITMDIEMPVMNGLDALQKIMKVCPTPIIMLSSLTQFGSLETITALQLGAVDFIPKPSGALSFDLIKVQTDLLIKLKVAAQSTVKKLKDWDSKYSSTIALSYKNHKNSTVFQHIVAIGASTGGPQALSTMLSKLPPEVNYPLLIVQHMPPKFTASLAKRLNDISNITVVEAKDGEKVLSGVAYIAPGDYHMNVIEEKGVYRIFLHKNMCTSRHRPSVDELFSSINKLESLKRHYILLTGMGKDGAEAMLQAKLNNATSTIAQAKESCVVYGMPKAAVEIGAVDYILPIESMINHLTKLTN